MYGLSYVWHGLLLTDLQEIHVPLPLYMVLAVLVYLIIGLLLTMVTHQAIMHEWIGFKSGFPFMAMLVGATIGFGVYLVVFILGVSFAKHGVQHVVADILWQMVEQALGGLMVGLGIVYDMHRRFLDTER